MDFTELVKRCQQEDIEAFEMLYNLYRNKALRTAYMISYNKEMAEDIVQEAFIICFKEISKLRAAGTFNVWFYRLLVRVAWRMSRKFKTQALVEIGQDAADTDSLEETFEINSNRAIVRRGIRKLKDPYRIVLILYYFNELPLKDISRILGCLQGTVKSRLHKARKLLKKEIETDISDEQIKSKYVVEGSGVHAR